MKKVIIIVFVLVIAAGGVIASLYTQIWNPSWNPFRPDPEVVLAEMAIKMKGLKTVRAEGDFKVENTSWEGGSLSIKIAGNADNSINDYLKSEGVLDVDMFDRETDISLSIDFITIDQTFYLKLTELAGLSEPNMSWEIDAFLGMIENQWIELDQENFENISGMFGLEYQPQMPEEEQRELANKLLDLLAGKRFYVVKEELEDTKIGGRDMYHYLITVDRDTIKELIPDFMEIVIDYYLTVDPEMFPEEKREEFEQELNYQAEEFFDRIGEIDFEVWIGQKDKYLYRVKFEKGIDLSGLVGSKGKFLINGEVNLSKFNQVMNVEPPEEFKTMEEILREIMTQYLEELGISIGGIPLGTTSIETMP